MNTYRRSFLKKFSLGLAAGSILPSGCGPAEKTNTPTDYDRLDQVLSKPVVDPGRFASPLILDKVELLHYQGNFICRVVTTEGKTGLCVSNNYRMHYLYPIFTKQVAPYFVGKDARQLDQLIEGVYTYKSNYKYQGYALWVPVATVEFAILDLLGKEANVPMGALLGEIVNPRIAVYQANNYRGKSAEESLELIRKRVEESGAHALKFKVGGRMRQAESPRGRSEKLIPMVRKAFGDDMTIYADSNGSYTTDEAIRIGRLMEEYAYDFFEEPVPFDWYEETLAVTRAINVPVAGGEQEPGTHNFRWLIAKDALDIVQPDIFYFGGMIRSWKVAQMAAERGKSCIPHISGSGLGYLYMMHFVSAVPNAGPYHEFKGFNNEIPLECATSDLKITDGRVKVPTGPGLGVDIDPDYLQKHKPVEVL